MKIALSSESSIDLPQNLLDEFNIHTVAFGINFNDELVDDHFGIAQQIFDFVDKSKVLPKTSAVSPQQYKDHFENLKKDYDAIIHICLSSCVTSAYNNAMTVANEMENVYVIDSKSISTGIAIMAFKARELIDKGYNPKEICDFLENFKSKLCVSTVLDKLNYLYRGGRCSALVAFGANLLNIKPQIMVKDGQLDVHKKYIGRQAKVTAKFFDDTLKDNPNPDLDYAFVTYSTNQPELQETLKQKLIDRGFKNVYVTEAGGTISSHTGPNCIGLIFANKE